MQSRSQAAVFERDWQAPGDGLLTYDDVNQRSWLDLSQTLLTSQFPGTGSGRELFESRYQYIASQTGPGGLFAGFTIGISGDVIALAESSGIDTSTVDFAINNTATSAVIELVGATPDPDPREVLSYGTLDELSGPGSDRRVLARFFIDDRGFAGQRIAADVDIHPARLFGVWMYRAVPEPSSCSAILVAVSGAAALGRNHRPYSSANPWRPKIRRNNYAINGMLYGEADKERNPDTALLNRRPWRR
jgi:hypothetical protein